MKNTYLEKSLFLFFSIIPLTIVLGPAISLINILLINLCFFIFMFYYKDYEFLKNKIVILLLLINIYLIFNSIISIDQIIGIKRNFGFLRFVIFFIVLNYFFYYSKNPRKIFFTWFVILFIFILDVYLEFITGSNILGFGDEEGDFGPRIVSFFKDEPIAGAFIYGFSFIVVGYLFNKCSEDKKNKVIILFLPLLLLISVLITGERSNTIKLFIGFMMFFLFSHFLNKKIKIFSILFFVIVVSIIFSQSQYLKLRYITQLTNHFIVEQKRKVFFKENLYFNLYKSGINVFKNYPIFGVGNKNYRVETCAPKKDPKTYYLCITHPHQLYIEFLSEHGLFGTIIFLSILFFLIFRILGIIIRSKNYIQAGCFIYILTIFIPLLPSGSFFSDFNSTIFWINFSLMYACNKQTNIFYEQDLKLKTT